MNSFVSLFKKPAILISALVALFLASLIIIIALFMGQESGNFVIQVESGNVRKSIHITENLESGNFESRLEAGGITGLSDSTYTRFMGRKDFYTNVNGMYADKDLHVYAYTFYILNDCAESLDVKATMYYSNVTNNLDKAIRVMTITTQGNLERCYQLEDEQEVDYGASYPTIINFANKGVAYEEDYLSFEPNETMKYTILIWIEGKDPECTDQLQLGTIRFTLKLSIN